MATLAEAVQTLVAWRARGADQGVHDKDTLWIEARLEERTAVLRFEELSHEEIRTRTLTGEPIADVRRSFESRARATTDVAELERLASSDLVDRRLPLSFRERP